MSEARKSSLPILALLLAWLVPGAGHAYLGRWRRGAVIFVMVAATFWTGVAIGGVLTVDYYAERWWFIAQTFTGAHGLAAWRMQNRVYQDVFARTGLTEDRAAQPHWQATVDRELAAKGVALVAPGDTIARAYSGVAGLMNLMCIFDALMLSLMGCGGEPAPAAVKKPEAT